MKKRWLCLMMATGLVMNLTACGGAKNTGATTGETTVAEETTVAGEVTVASEANAEETTAESTDAAEFSRGTWDGNTFTSNWLNMKVTFPDDATIMTEEEIKQATGAGQEVLKDSGNVSDAQVSMSEALSVYDFMVWLPDGSSNASLVYEDVLGRKMDGEAYLAQVQEQLAAVADLQYEFNEIENVTLGGNTFAKLHASAMGGSMYQDYYSMNKDGRMVSMIISYLPDSQEMAEEIVSSITTAE